MMVIFCVLLSFLLRSAQLSDDELQGVKEHAHSHALQQCINSHKTLEVRFVDQDKNVFGVFWDICKLPSEDQGVWHYVSSGITGTVFEAFPIDVLCVERSLKKLKKLLFSDDDAVRYITGVPPLTVTHMDAILHPQTPERPTINVWSIQKTLTALDEHIPGMVSITVMNADCCLVRVPRVLPRISAAASSLAALTLAQQKTVTALCLESWAKVNALSEQMTSLPDRLQQRFEGLDAQIEGLKEQVAGVKQRLTVLEKGQRKHTARTGGIFAQNAITLRKSQRRKSKTLCCLRLSRFFSRADKHRV